MARRGSLIELLTKLEPDELRRVLIESARGGNSFDRRGLLNAALRLQGADAAALSDWYREYKYNEHSAVDLALDRLWWEWCTVGVAFPIFGHGNQPGSVIVEGIRLTPGGVSALGSTDAPHPLSDAYRGGLDGLDDEMKARLEDAALCYRASLPRAAMVMVGIAYEHTVDVVAQAFGIKEKLHAPRIEALRKRFESLPDKDARTDALFALSLARAVTIERNGAGHPGTYERPSQEVEEFIWRAPHWLRKLLVTRMLA